MCTYNHKAMQITSCLPLGLKTNMYLWCTKLPLLSGGL